MRSHNGAPFNSLQTNVMLNLFSEKILLKLKPYDKLSSVGSGKINAATNTEQPTFRFSLFKSSAKSSQSSLHKDNCSSALLSSLKVLFQRVDINMLNGGQA